MDAALALLAAWGFSAAAVSSRRGLVSTSVMGGFAVSLTAGLVVAVGLAAFDFPNEIRWSVIPVLVVAGLLGSMAGRLLVIAGVSRLGTTIHIPLQSSVQPLLGVAGGWLLFGESVGFQRFAGTLAIICGIWLAASAGRASMGAQSAAVVSHHHDDSTIRRYGLVVMIPIAAGVAFAASDIASKEAMSEFAFPAFGAAVGAFSSWLGWGTAMGVSRRLRRRTVVGRGFGWFVLHGAFAASASLAYFSALEVGDVSVVSPILASQPVWVILLSLLLLRRLERIGTLEVAGALFVVSGALMIVMS